MKLLVLDGNSILNRAFYGIRLLTTKDGRPTNGIYGFLTILLKLLEDLSPDGVAAAFDLRAPTFRHKMYAGYKANRKGMPPELAAQLEPLKEILTAMGIRVLACEGWEADDILGTLAHACRQENDQCVIATGDRDSLQLVGDGVTVRLATTRQGRPEATLYDEQAIKEQYGILPRQLIDVKALQGDSSDNIPGVAGIGPKTACALVQQFGSLDGVYQHLDDESIKNAVRNKLAAGKDSAYLSRELGIIRVDAPVDLDPKHYLLAKRDDGALARLLAHQELFSLIDRLHLTSSAPVESQKPQQSDDSLEWVPQPEGQELMQTLQKAEKISLSPVQQDGEPFSFVVRAGNILFHLKNHLEVLCTLESPIFCEDSKAIYKAFMNQGIPLPGHLVDVSLAAYLLNPSASGYDVWPRNTTFLLLHCLRRALPTPQPGRQSFLPWPKNYWNKSNRMVSMNCFTPSSFPWPKYWLRWSRSDLLWIPTASKNSVSSWTAAFRKSRLLFLTWWVMNSILILPSSWERLCL